MTIAKYKIPIYFGSLWVVFSDNFIEDGKKIGVDFTENSNDCLGLAFKKRGDKDIYCVFIKTNRVNDMSVIAHEAYHISNYIFEDIHAKPSLKNDEPQAYLIGWIVKQIQKTALKIK